MPKTIYALLVAVDNYYPGTVSNLRGCKRDITAFDAYLEGRVAKEKHSYKPFLLTDNQATRQAVIDAFRSHLGQAKKGDQVVFYFSGHGSRAKVPEKLKYLEPDGLMESLVCHDSRAKNSSDLVDKELSYLIYEVAQNEPEITIVLDCCHSGTGTRSDEIGIRQAADDERDRSVDTFLFMENKAMLDEIMASDAEETGKLRLPKGEHILLAACQANQFAKEKEIDDVPKGIFSYFLLDSLRGAGHGLTYRDLFMRVNALVKANVSEQNPQLETTNSDILERPFLGGTIQPTPKHFTVSYDKELGWVVDAGAIHGINQPRKEETTHFALYPYDATVNDLHDLSRSEKSVSIKKVMSTYSQVTNNDLDDLTTYKAVITALPINPLLVQFNGNKKAIDILREALASYGPNDEPSFLVQEAEKKEAPTLVLDATDDHYQIRRVGDNEPLVVGTKSGGREDAETAVSRLEHIARWHNLMNLKHPANSLSTNAIKLRFEVKDEHGKWMPADQEIILKYRQSEQPSFWQKPEFRMSLINESRRPLFCMLLDLTEKYKISSLTESDGLWLEAGEEFQVFEGETIEGSVPDDFWQQGRTTFRDTLKLIVTTEESYARRLEQDNLPVTVNKTRTTLPDLPQPDTLTRLMHRSGTRDLGRKKPKKVSEWYALETVFTTVRPKEAKNILQ